MVYFSILDLTNAVFCLSREITKWVKVDGIKRTPIILVLR